MIIHGHIATLNARNAGKRGGSPDPDDGMWFLIAGAVATLILSLIIGFCFLVAL